MMTLGLMGVVKGDLSDLHFLLYYFYTTSL